MLLRSSRSAASSVKLESGMRRSLFRCVNPGWYQAKDVMSTVQDIVTPKP